MAWMVAGWLAVLTLALLAGLLRSSRRHRHELADLRADLAQVAGRLDRPSTPSPAPSSPAPEYLITRVGEGPRPDQQPPAAPVLPVAPFADQVLRESVVTAASLVHGVRRALSPQVRDRIRGEMRREVKRSRRQRRSDLRTARREWEARQRASPGDLDEGSAA